jgi:hypothetical protein
LPGLAQLDVCPCLIIISARSDQQGPHGSIINFKPCGILVIGILDGDLVDPPFDAINRVDHGDPCGILHLPDYPLEGGPGGALLGA